MKFNFYSHAPCGARPSSGMHKIRPISFLLTRPLRGATGEIVRKTDMIYISTHTPLAGRDLQVVTA